MGTAQGRIEKTCDEVLGMLQPLGLLKDRSRASLIEFIKGMDGIDEFLDQMSSRPMVTRGYLITMLDPNGLHNPADKGAEVAKWNPPLLSQTGLHGKYDPKTRRVSIERAGRVVAEGVIEHTCHAAEIWNTALKPLGYEILIPDLDVDDESFVAVTSATSQRLQDLGIIRAAKPCPHSR